MQSIAVLTLAAIACICITLAWCAWIWRPQPVVTVEQPAQPPEPVHGATPELGQWLRENDVQAARFDRGNLIEVVLKEGRPEAPAKSAGSDGDSDGPMSKMDEALALLASGKGSRARDEAS